MKVRNILIISLLLVVCLVARSSDLFLLPDNFFLHKGDNLTLHLLSADFFSDPKNAPHDAESTSKFALYDNSKNSTDLKSSVKENDSTLLTYKTNNTGLFMIEMVRKFPSVDVDRAALIKELDQEQLTKLSEKASASFQEDIKERYTAYLKTLFVVDKTTGIVFNKELGQELEIILGQNPYKLGYGDDMTAIVKFKGKPLSGAHVDLLIKTATGRIVPERLTSDASGTVFFKMGLEGNYMLRTVNIETTKAKDLDYEKWSAAYTFAFINTRTVQKSY